MKTTNPHNLRHHAACRQAARLKADGYTTRQIADTMHLDPKQVKAYVLNGARGTPAHGVRTGSRAGLAPRARRAAQGSMMSSRFQPPSIKFRGAVARAMAAVQEQKKPGQDATGKVPCTWCRGSISFTVYPSGLSRGRCLGGCGVEWVQ